MPRRFEEHPGRIIVLKGKHGDYPLFARTKAEELRAYLVLFKHLDEDAGYYDRDDMDEDQQRWYDAAKQGDGEAARWLLQVRSDYEYEHISVEYIETPPAEQPFVVTVKSDGVCDYVLDAAAAHGVSTSKVQAILDDYQLDGCFTLVFSVDGMFPAILHNSAKGKHAPTDRVDNG